MCVNLSGPNSFVRFIRQALGSALPLGELCVPILVWVEKFRPGRIPAGASSTGGQWPPKNILHATCCSFGFDRLDRHQLP
jgi:hypothetical protein